MSQVINFVACGSLDSGSVSKADRVIRGVSMITGGVIAKGHDLHVDDITLHQLQMCASRMGQVPVKVNHKTGAEAVCGYLTGFRRDGNKLRADWHLLESHPQTNQILETAEKMPGCVGLSVSFVSPPKPTIEDGVKKARCQELVSTDYVVTPAANPDGLFGRAGVDNQTDSKPTAMNEELLAQLKTIISEAIAPVTARLDAIEAQANQANDDLPQTPEEIAAYEAQHGVEATEEYLAELGLTRAEVNQAHADAQAALAEGDGDLAGDQGGDQGDGATATAGAGAPAAAGAAAGFEARIERMVTNLERQFAARADREAQVQFQSEVQELTDFINGQQARIEALEEQLGYAQNPSVSFSGFNPQTTDLSENTFEGQVELKAQQLASTNPSWSKRKVQVEALNFVRRNNPKLHAEFRSRFGKITSV